MERVSVDVVRGEQDPVLRVSGSLSADNCEDFLSTFERQVAAEPSLRTLELLDFEILDGVSAGKAVDSLRKLLHTREHLTLLHSPQVLGHVFYRVGLLRDDRLRLVATREEEPYG